MLLALILLLVALAGVAVLVARDRAAYRRFKAIEDTAARQRLFRRWIVVSFALFAGYTLVSLAVLGRLDALVDLPAAFLPAWLWFGGAAPSADDLGPFAMGAAIGLVTVGVAVFIGRWRRRGKPRRPDRLIGDIAPLLPRNRAELAHVAVLSINAGLSEELFFRLLLPLLFVLLIGNVWIAFALATIVFGLAHAYQGWVGVIATTVVGAALAFFYLLSGNLWLAVAVHALIDLGGLVVRPVLSGRVRWSAAAEAAV